MKITLEAIERSMFRHCIKFNSEIELKAFATYAERLGHDIATIAEKALETCFKNHKAKYPSGVVVDVKHVTFQSAYKAHRSGLRYYIFNDLVFDPPCCMAEESEESEEIKIQFEDIWDE